MVSRRRLWAVAALLVAVGPAACDDAPDPVGDAGGDAADDADMDGGDADAAACDAVACDASCRAAGGSAGGCEGGECVCRGDPGGPWAPVHGADPVALAWDGGCLGDAPTGLLADLLAATGTSAAELAYTDDEWARASYAPYLDDAALLSWYADVGRRPLAVPCFTAALTAALDDGVARGAPVSSAVALAAWALDLPVRPLVAPPAPADVEHPLAEALETFVALAGGEPDAAALAEAAADVPREVQDAVAPIVRAMGPVVAAREAWVGTYEAAFPVMLFYQALGTFLPSLRTPMDLTDAATQRFLFAPERGALYQAAHDLAATVEGTDWAALAGLDATFDVATPVGRVVIGGRGDDTYTEDVYGEEIALLVDLGGDDVYEVPAGATGSGESPVSVHVDVAGSDRYGYEEVGDPDDEPWLLPSDERDTRYAGGGGHGPISVSSSPRQGAGVLGVGLLFDLGDARDEYRSLRASQGAGVLGVGAVLDEGGDDLWLAEAAAQGAAYFGIGVAIDAGAGNDERRLFHQGQGFGYVAGAGLLWDGGGDDRYLADIGSPDLGGHPLYASAQLPGRGNSSFTGGAGFGRRGDHDGVFWSGGLGVLRDAGQGSDEYTASVFGLGTGYWQGVGLLVDGGGDDTYDALWYVMGGAAHYALGALFDHGGDDTYGGLRGVVGVSQGSGHDFSVGVLWDGGGRDWHFAGSLGMGTGNCNGIGLAIDEDGADTYVASTGGSHGMARTSTECDAVRDRQVVATMGFLVDAGGDDDDWSAVPDGTDEAGAAVHRANGTTWVYNAASEFDIAQHGGGVDGDGGSGFAGP
jgi:hypothetical protein